MRAIEKPLQFQLQLIVKESALLLMFLKSLGHKRAKVDKRRWDFPVKQERAYWSLTTFLTHVASCDTVPAFHSADENAASVTIKFG